MLCIVSEILLVSVGSIAHKDNVADLQIWSMWIKRSKKMWFIIGSMCIQKGSTQH